MGTPLRTLAVRAGGFFCRHAGYASYQPVHHRLRHPVLGIGEPNCFFALLAGLGLAAIVYLVRLLAAIAEWYYLRSRCHFVTDSIRGPGSLSACVWADEPSTVTAAPPAPRDNDRVCHHAISDTVGECDLQ